MNEQYETYRRATGLDIFERRGYRGEPGGYKFVCPGVMLGDDNVVITWPEPFPDEFYGVWPTIYTTNPAQVHCVPLSATKTAEGITFTVVAASAVGMVTLDVLGVRT